MLVSICYVLYCCALRRAAYSGYGEIIKCLVIPSADVNKPLSHLTFSSVLQLVISGCDLDTFKYLVQDGHADVNMPLRGMRAGSVLEHAAAAYKQFAVVQYMVEEASADFNLTSPNSKYGSPLAAAAHESDEPEMASPLAATGHI